VSNSQTWRGIQPLWPPRLWLLYVDCGIAHQMGLASNATQCTAVAALPPLLWALLLTHALPQALNLSPYMLATELLLEPGDSLQGRALP
jgi:hypothetical protein